MLLDRSSVIAALQIRCDMLAADFDSTMRRFESRYEAKGPPMAGFYNLVEVS